MKYYLIVGEASGDLHGANLMKAIRASDPKAEFRFWGGDRMSAHGGEPVVHYRHMAFMGFLEVVKNLRTITRRMKQCKEDIVRFSPDVLVLIDYPGFNMRMAAFAKEIGIKVAYYISPQVWAWKENRVAKLKKTVDEMLVILPFEEAFFAERGMKVHFVGHPLLDAIGDKSEWLQGDPEKWKSDSKSLIALLPGSRAQEVSKVLPVMLEMVDRFPQHRFAIGMAPSLPKQFYQDLIGKKDVELIENATYSLLAAADAALVTSGTATLETALFGVPEVVCYRGSYLSYIIAKRLVKVPYISLANLVVNREIVKELIQDELNPKQLEKNLHDLFDEERREQFERDFDELRSVLGGGGASRRAAEHIVQLAER